ncbi:MAG: 3-phosphoglycerate dehydrogenase [Oscillospiraceae bacterium]|nr:3-phosphoglycerate dehydrogenase [Oscillospiraceae bacterium]
MYNIKTVNKISATGLALLDSSKYTCADTIENPDAILVRSASLHEAEFEPSLKAIARAGAGVNNIPIDRCSQQGIVVFNTPGANANAVKELVILGLLIGSRKVGAAMEWVQGLKGSGDEVSKLVEKGKGQFVGPELMGKKLGVIGLGAIGVLVANLARHFGMEVYGYDPYLSVDNAWELSRVIHHAHSLKEIYENCDYITMHIPATPDTKGSINAETIAQMKDGVRLLNFSRGELVVSADVIDAIKSGKMASYVTDFPSDDMLGVDGITAIPHLGASTPESEENCAHMAVKQVADFLENGNIKNSVNMPNLSMERSGVARIGVIHYNKPAVITKISAVIAEDGLNIENLTNKSKKDYAYTLIDVAEAVSDKIIEDLKKVENVIRVIVF